MMVMVVTTGAKRHAKLQSNRYHQLTNTQVLFTGQMPFPVRALKKKASHSMDLITFVLDTMVNNIC